MVTIVYFEFNNETKRSEVEVVLSARQFFDQRLLWPRTQVLVMSLGPFSFLQTNGRCYEVGCAGHFILIYEVRGAVERKKP